VNDIMTFQWEFSVLEKSNGNKSELLRICLENLTCWSGSYLKKKLDFDFGLCKVTSVRLCAPYFGIVH
jgi:hypothetical protein